MDFSVVGVGRTRARTKEGFMAKGGTAEVEEASTGFLRRTKRRWASRLSLPRGWKRPYISWSLLRSYIVDGLLFKIASAFELLALVSMLAFYFLCCGCSF